jgi:hydroxymethylpyrimidine/phosphomethylpyrimidine kinase
VTPARRDGDPPVALTIAGTDSGGAAGIAADLQTFAAHGVYGTLAVTAVTAQDTTGVHGVLACSPAMVDAQIGAVLGDLPVLSVKTGMLANLDIVRVVAERAAAGRLPQLVVDPVMVASSGDPLLEGDAVSAYRGLLAYALVTTPNLPEAGLLLGREVKDVDSMIAAARDLHQLGASVVVVKGGHLPTSAEAVDVVFDGSAVTLLRGPWTETRNVHGSGCTLSAAIAARLALGEDPITAAAGAKRYVARAIAGSAAWRLGRGHGPLDRLGTARHESGE